MTWRVATLERAGDHPTWWGDIVDPFTYEKVDVLTDRAEAERREAVLFMVAGAHYRRNVLARPEFAAGREVVLVPDGRNKHDRNGVEVRDASGRYSVGFVPRDRPGDLFAQELLHRWLAQGPVAALIVSERAWMDEDGVLTSQRGGFTVLAGRQIECVEIPGHGEAEYAEFTASRLAARAEAWTRRRSELRYEIDRSRDLEDRHFAIQTLMQEAYRLREAHPEALDDALAACREQIDLAPRVATVMRRRYGTQLPEHAGYRQLAIVLEKQKAYGQAVDLIEQARTQGWDGDWDKRLTRLRRRQS